MSGVAQKIGQSLENVGGIAGKVAGMMLEAGVAIGVALGGALVVATKKAADFQQAMALLQTQAGASQAEVDSMSKSVLALAGQVGFAPEELAKGLYHIESAGFRGATALEALRIAAEGAKVGQANLEDVTNALNAVLVAGVPEAQNMTQAMGELNAIVGAGDMRMQDLAEAMGTGVLATAKTFGLGLKDVGAALAVFGDNNIRGAEGATKLRMAISLMGAPTQAAAKALATIGLASSDLADAMRGPDGLVGAMQLLQDHLVGSGKDATEQAQILSEAFGGGRTAGAIMILLQQLDRLKTKEAEVADGAKKFPSAWEQTQKTLNVQLDKFHAALDAAAISMGTKLLPYATKFMEWLIPMVPIFAAWVNDALPKAIDAVGKFGQMVEKILPPILGWINSLWVQLRPALEDIMKRSGDFVPILEAIGIVLGALIIVIANLIVGFVRLVDWVLKTHDEAIVPLQNAIMDFTNNALVGLVTGLIGVVHWLERVYDAAVAAIGAISKVVTGGGASTGNSALDTALKVGGYIFDEGGYVPGPPGSPHLAIVHGGELVLNQQQQQAAGGGGATTIVINLDGQLIARYLRTKTDLGPSQFVKAFSG